jgi:hypothetical protein
MKPGAPNLDDSMTRVELVTFWYRTDKATFEVARELFPGVTGRVVLEAVRDLGLYAANKAAARLSREMGDIETARMYEDICERIYNRLPSYAKW